MPRKIRSYTAVASENFALTIAGNSMADTVLDGGAAVQILRLDVPSIGVKFSF